MPRRKTVKLGVEAFKVHLLGKPFVIQTDHSSLVWLDRLNEGNPQRSLALQPYQFQVVHRAGTMNGNADVLSRSPNYVWQEKEGGV